MTNEIEYDPGQAYLKRELAAQEFIPPRLIFALDATSSRQPTWDEASKLQAEMFAAAPKGMQVQLCYFRGDECRNTQWLPNSASIAKAMGRITCVMGYTQIGRVLEHALKENRTKVRGVVFVGDAFEENLAEVGGLAAELGRAEVPAFMFKEAGGTIADGEAAADRAFKKIAQLSGGRAFRFDASAPKELADLLRMVGAFAASGGTVQLTAATERLLLK
jgi:hypothetical protein